MNKEEAKQKLHNLAFVKLDTRPNDLKLADVMQIVNQIDELVKVTIPKFVAEWIEKTKRTYNLYGAMGHIKDNSAPFEIMKWFSTNPTLTGEIFARAWLDGYEIEQEQLYTVEIPNPNNTSRNVLALQKLFTDIEICRVNAKTYKTDKHCQFTEAEIKQDFDWAWKWAKPVEE
ncbi:DUF1642 domain-containing protein [Streptococcus fryi]